MNKDIKYVNPVGSDFDEQLEGDLKDPEMAAHFINAAVEEHDSRYLKVALGKVVRIHGVTEISKMAKLNRESIYKMLGPDSNPGFENIIEILDACGLEITVQPKGLIAEREQKVEPQYVRKDDLIEILENFMLKRNLNVVKSEAEAKTKATTPAASRLRKLSARSVKITTDRRSTKPGAKRRLAKKSKGA